MVGWYGAIAVVSSYTLVSFGAISASGYLYQLLNLTGAAGIAYISIKKKAKQPAVSNTVWAIIAFVAIINLAVHG